MGGRPGPHGTTASPVPPPGAVATGTAGRSAPGGARPLAPVLRTWLERCTDVLGAHRAALDTLNVFPVADADTGSNLTLTLGHARDAVARLRHDADAATTAAAAARGALVGARGSSGVIVGQYVGALVGSLAAAGDAWSTGTCLAAALRAAADAARRAVARPVEGTVLSVARSAADAAEEAARAGGDALRAAVRGAEAALRRTPHELEALRRAGVVDAGGQGLVLLLGELRRAHVGEPGASHRTSVPVGPAPGAAPATAPGTAPRTGGTPSPGCCAAPRTAEGEPDVVSGGAVDPDALEPDGLEPDRLEPDAELEVMAVLRRSPGDGHGSGPVDGPADDAVAARLRRRLAAVGSSVAVVAAPDLWHAHVHTDDLAGALAALDGPGLSRAEVGVRHLRRPVGVEGPLRPVLGLVTVTAAPGLARDLARTGAVVVLCEPGAPLGEGAVERAAADCGADDVLVLVSRDVPGGGEVGAPAGCRVLRVPEVALAAAAATYAAGAAAPDGRRAGGEALRDLVAAVGRIRTGTVGPAVGGGDVGGEGHPGLVSVLTDLIRGPVGSPPAELLTVMTRASTPVSLVQDVRAAAAGVDASVEVVALDGGGPGAHLEIAAEGGW